MEGTHLDITCTWTMNNQEIPTHALIDCGVTGVGLMDQDFAGHHQIPRQELKEKNQVEVLHGGPIEAGDMRHIAKAGLKYRTKRSSYLCSLRS
jgi:hypothetical protein